MKQIRVMIVDDEPIAIEVIRELVNYLTPDLMVEGTATNGMDALKQISVLKPDLVFMDVDMPLMNGLEVLEKVPDRSFQLIFTTGFESHAIKNLKHEVTDYLFKPIDPAEFMTAVEKARVKMKLGNGASAD
jgi:two-component system LytT family response regulator